MLPLHFQNKIPVRAASCRIGSMRSVAMLLCATLFGLNAEAALLHVHKGDLSGHHHHDGPAAHEHRIKVELPPAHSQFEARDDDGSAVPVVVVKAGAAHTQQILATNVVVAKADAPHESRTPLFVVTSRAHAPPAVRPRSPRAPPRSIQP